MAAFTVRRMELRDLETGLQLTQAVRWSHRLADWEFLYRLGRGWVVCNESDRPIGTAMWWPYGDDFGTVGLIVVDPAQQGKGIGRLLITQILEDAAPRVLQLVATQAGLKLYQQHDFREVGGIAQHQGEPTSTAAVAPPPGVVMRSVRREDLRSVRELDATAFGAHRDAVIDAVFEAGEGLVAERNGQLAGFALMRQAGRGALIGPLVASDERLAISLVSRLLQQTSGFVRLDIPTDAPELAAWCESVGVACVDRVTTMIRGKPPQKRSDARIFSLVSQALS